MASQRKREKQPFQGKQKYGQDDSFFANSDFSIPQQFKKAPPLEPKTEAQRRYINAIKNFQVVFGLGKAGTGKTYIAGSIACDLLDRNLIDKLYITRPAVDAGESLGFLPGELEDKYAPYIGAFREVLNERLGKSRVEYMIKTGKIEAIPFAYMRGHTFKNAMVILDEAQNSTKEQMKLFLTRVGENCKVVIDGDESQTDIRNSGLLDAVNRVQHIPSVKVVKFSKSDVVRSGFVQEVLEAYDVE